MPPMPPITRALLLVNVAVFCIQMLVGPVLERVLALWPWASGLFFPWQLFSYAFLHGDVGHLFFNMLGLWMFGAELEALWGPRRFAQYYSGGVLCAAVTQMVLSAALGLFNPMVGASGGLFALLLGWGMLFPHRVVMPLFPPIPMKARTFVTVYAVLELVLGLSRPNGGVAHFAHLGGLLGGWLVLRYWRGQPPFGGFGGGGSGGGGRRSHLHRVK